MKTGILISCACLMGGVIAGQEPSPPRLAPASIDGQGSNQGSNSAQFAPADPSYSQVAPPPAPYGSAGPAGPYAMAPPPPPPAVWDSNPAGPQRGWLDGEFLVWWINSGPNPVPLGTNGSLADFSPGAFGQPGTTAVTLGGHNFNYDAVGGLRLSGGYWFGDEQRVGLGGSIFFIADQTVHHGVGSDDNGNPGIYRPVNDGTFGEVALFVAVPGLASGAMFVSSSSQLWGAEVNGYYRMLQRNNVNLVLLGGFRFLDLNEKLNIDSFTDDFAGVLPGPANGGAAEVPGSTLGVFDRFHTRNDFYGGQLGVQTTWAFAPRWFLSARAQIGLGETHQSVTISGLTVQDQPGVGVTTAPAGALATASNSGHFTHDAFSVVPEAQFKLGYQFSPRWSGFVGYNFLYWSNVVRPGNQISRTVDLRAIPTSGIYDPTATTTAPGVPSFHQSGFWAQGMNFGLQFAY